MQTRNCKPIEVPKGKKLIFRAWVKLPDGSIRTARQLGIRGIPIIVDA